MASGSSDLQWGLSRLVKNEISQSVVICNQVCNSYKISSGDSFFFFRWLYLQEYLSLVVENIFRKPRKYLPYQWDIGPTHFTHLRVGQMVWESVGDVTMVVTDLLLISYTDLCNCSTKEARHLPCKHCGAKIVNTYTSKKTKSMR